MADQDELIKLSLHDYNRKYHMCIDNLKIHQLHVVRSILTGDTIAMLPTGYGKSLTYEILPDVCQHIFHKPAFVLVIVPLNVILTQQLEKLGSFAALLNNVTVKDSSERRKFTEGHIHFAFAHPEQVLDSKTINEVLLTSYFQEEAMTFIIIDEAHCVLEWGQDFRPQFSKLRSLRAVLPNAKMLALSATLSIYGQKEVAKSLGMNNYSSIVTSPARDNISIVVCKRPPSLSAQHSVEYIVEPLLIELIRKGQSFPLTIVYISGSQDWVGISYELAERMLGDKFYSGGSGLQFARVVQFHASLEKSSHTIKTTIFKNLIKDPCHTPLKLVFATVALGMGADLRHVRRVISIGPPKRLEAYVQQMGRAGRSGEQSVAVMYFNNADIGRPGVSTEMKAMCRNISSCRREYINKGFGFDHTDCSKSVSATECCDICNPDLAKPHLHSSSPILKDTLRNALLAYIGRDTTGHLISQLPLAAVHQIICAPDVFCDPCILMEEYGLDLDVATTVANIIIEIQNISADM